MDSTPVQPRHSDTCNGCGMRERNAQLALLAASSQIICNGYVSVANSLTLNMKTAEWTQHWYNLLSVICVMDAVCVNAMRSPHCLLHPERLFVMATFV